MRSFATEDNPDLVLAKQQLAALQSQLEQIAGSQKDTGSDIVLSKGRVTRTPPTMTGGDRPSPA